MNRIALSLAITCYALSPTNHAAAALLVSFDRPSYTVAAPGSGVDVRVLVSQTPGGPQVAGGNELLAGGIVVSYGSPPGIVGLSLPGGISAGPSWTAASSAAGPTSASLVTTSLPGIADLTNPLLVGTFHFTGLSLGTTTLSVANLAPGPSFETARRDILDPSNVATATVAVVPEPSSAALCCGAALLLGVARVHRRVAAKPGRPFI